MKKYVAMYDRLPPGYGVAYWDEKTLHGVLFPVPINMVVRWSRWLYLWLVRGGLRGMTRTELAECIRNLEAARDYWKQRSEHYESLYFKKEVRHLDVS